MTTYVCPKCGGLMFTARDVVGHICRWQIDVPKTMFTCLLLLSILWNLVSSLCLRSLEMDRDQWKAKAEMLEAR